MPNPEGAAHARIPKITPRPLAIEQDAGDQETGKNEEEAHTSSRALQRALMLQFQIELRMEDEDCQDCKTTGTIELRNVTGKSDVGLACQVLHIPRPGYYAPPLPLAASCQRMSPRTCLGMGMG